MFAILFENWKLIFLNAIPTLAVAYFFLDSNIAKRWRLNLGNRKEDQGVFWTYFVVFAYSALFVVIVKVLADAAGYDSRIHAYVGWLVLAAIGILLPERLGDNRQALATFIFVQATSLIAIITVIFTK